MIISLFILALCVLLGTLGGELLWLSTLNKQLKRENARLRVQNDLMTRISYDNFRYNAIREELIELRMKTEAHTLNGEQFCKEVARIIQRYCK